MLPSNPPVAVSSSVGKKAARAIPICSLASAARRSAAAMSGRRSSSCDGTPTGITGGVRVAAGIFQPQALRGASHQNRDGMFERRALHADADILRARGLQLSSRLRHFRARAQPALDSGSASIRAPADRPPAFRQATASARPGCAARNNRWPSSACRLRRIVSRSPAVACASSRAAAIDRWIAAPRVQFVIHVDGESVFAEVRPRAFRLAHWSRGDWW